MRNFNSAQSESFISLLFKHPIALFLTLTLHAGLIAVMVLNVIPGERIKPAPTASDSRIAKVQKAENEIIQTTVVDEALVQKFIGEIEKRKLKEQKEQDRRLKKIAQAEQNLKKSKAQTAKQKKQAELAAKRANEKAKKAKQELAASEKKKKNLLKEQQAIQKKAKLAEEKRKKNEEQLSKIKKQQALEAEKAAKERERLAKLTQDEQKRLKELQLEKQLQQENAKKQQLQAEAENAKLEQIQQSRLAEIKRLYIASIEQTVRKNWRKPNKYDNAWSCEVLVEQNAKGEVGDVKTENCTGDEKFINSVERAVFRSDPLPLPKDKRIFENKIRFRFSP